MRFRKTLLAAALAATLLPLPAGAQTTSPPTPADPASIAAKRAELERAERELAEARERVRELRRELGVHGPRSQAREFRIVTESRRSMIGVVFGDDGRGVYVRAVTPGSGADQAGLRAGDRIVAINGRDLAEALKSMPRRAPVEVARELVGRPKDGETVRLAVLRDGERIEVAAVAQKRSHFAWSGDGEMPARLRRRLEALEGGSGVDVDALVERALERAGEARVMAGRRALLFREGTRDLRLAPLNPELGKFFGAESGVLVLEQKNPRFAPLQTGDVITSVGGERVASPSDVMRALRRHDPGTAVNVEVVRERKRQVLVLTVPERPSFYDLWPTPPAPPATPPAPPAPSAGLFGMPVPPAPPAPRAPAPSTAT
jgi:predicted metalloprotease with PDZ domain